MAVLGSNVATWVIMLVVVAVVTEHISPAELGEYQLAITVWAIGTVFIVAGLDTKVALEASLSHEHGLQLVPATYTARLLAFAAVSMAVIVAIVVLGYTSDERLYIAIVGVATLATVIGQVANSILVGREDFVVASRIGVAVRFAVAIATVVAVALFDRGVPTILLLTAAGSIASTAFVLRHARRFGVSTRLSGPREGLAMLRLGAPFLFGAVALVLYREMDIFVMRALLDSDALGWYAVADRLIGIVMTLPFVLLTVAFPRMARVQDRRPAEADDTFADAFDSSLLIGVPAGLGMACVAQNITDLLLGDAYRPAGAVLSVMGVMLALTFQTTLLGHCAIVMNRQRTFYRLLFGAALLTLPLDLVLVPFAERRYDNGAIGGALSFLVTETLLIVVSLALIAPFVRRRATVVRTAKVLVAGGCMVAAIWPIRSHFILLPVVVGVVVYVSVTFALRTTRPDERDRVVRLVARINRMARRRLGLRVPPGRRSGDS